MVRSPFGLHHNIINITPRCFIQHIIKDSLYCSLVCCSSILQTKGYYLIAEDSFTCAKNYGFYVFWCHLDLIVPCSTIHKGDGFVSHGGINHELRNDNQKSSFGQPLLRFQKSTHMRSFPFFFLTRTTFAIQVEYFTSRMNPISMNLLTSFSISRTNSGWKH